MITRCFCAIGALAIGLMTLVDGTAGAAAATSKWTRLRTPSFTILGDQGERPLRRVAERLEQFREVIARVFPNTQRAMPAPVIVHLFASERGYRPFMPSVNGKRIEVGGLFQQTTSASYITLNAEAGEQAYPIVFKGYVHLLVGNALADVPVWFSTGLAEYYGTYEMYGEREAVLGKVNEDHVLALRERFLPLGELLAFNRLASFDRDEDRRRLFHAEAWALVHYLLIGNPQREGQLSTYLEKYAKGVPQATALREAFGVGEAELEKELRGYIRHSAYRSTRVRFQEKVAIDKDWTIEHPTEADAQAAFADLFYALRRPEDAAARAEVALKEAPEHARALAVLARVRAAQGQPDVASTLIARAVKASGEKDYLPPYHHALLLLRGEGQVSPTVTPDTARAALASLGRVTALEPSLADAHGLAAYAWLVAGNPQAAKAAAAAAYTASPRHEYALLHARARVHLRDPDVRTALAALVSRGSTDWIKSEAQELLDFVAKLDAPGPMASASRPSTAARPTDAADTPDPPASPSPTRVVPVFRTVGEGETREIGTFEAIQCSRDGLVFTVRLAARLVRVAAKAFDQVQFLTYRSDPPGQVVCGPRPKPDRIYLTYRSTGGAPGTDGVAVAIEMLPDDFQP